MIRLTCALALVSLLCCATFSESVAARDSHASLRSLGSKRRLEAVKRLESSPGRRSRASRAGDTSASPGVKNITFTNPKASGAYAALCILLSISCAFQSSTLMVQKYPWWILTLARHGLA